MTQFLISRFIRHPEDTETSTGREAYGRLAGGVGIALNLLMAAGKFAAGLATNSISVMADAFNNLSDAGSSVVTLAGFHLAGKQADADHPFGHGRIEYLSGLFVSALILMVGVELLKTSVDKILHPQPILFSPLSAAILAVAVCVKLWLSHFNRTLGRKIRSTAMEATAADSLSDAVATGAVLLGLGIHQLTDKTVDGWVGVLGSFFILKAGWEAAKETIDPLLGKPADPELVHAIERAVLSHSEICGIHDLVLHDYGPGRRMLSFHAEVPADCDLMATHDLIDNVERELEETFQVETVIHMDPIRTDEHTLRLRIQTAELVRSIDPVLTIHDFRITAGPSHTNLIFDVVAPYGFALSEAALAQAIQEKLNDLNGTYYAVIKVDHAYTEME